MNPGSLPDRWEQGDAYEQYVGRWSRKVAPQFLAWLQVPAGRRWLDVGSGTGRLSATILALCSPASIIAVEPSDGFRAHAQAQFGKEVSFRAGHAEQLPLDDGSVDVTVSGLVLNFVPNIPAALAEMRRVTTDGGTVGAYVWDYAGKMEMMRIFWDAAAELDPTGALLDEGTRFPICHPDALRDHFAGAGLVDIAVTGIEIDTHFTDFDDYWRPFLGGQGSAPTYAMSLDEAARLRLRQRIADRLPIQPDGAILLTARAWAVRAIRPR